MVTGMTNRCYLLSLEEFWDDIDGERLLQAALEKVDTARREKAERMRFGKTRAVCVGAGLLLQLAVQEALETDGVVTYGKTMVHGTEAFDEEEVGVTGSADELAVYSVSQVLELVREPRELIMNHGEKGKPYLREYPLFFNLSHSGEYVFCAVSDREVGVDIQQCTAANTARIARRFFTEHESSALAACESEEERQQLFFRLWARKEAFGKLLGEGFLGAASVNLLPEEGGAGVTQNLCWREWDLSGEYRITVCQRKEKMD